MIPKIYLKPGKDASLKRGHPWVFSGAILKMEGNPADGDLVHVLSTQGKPLGIAHYQTGSIALRMLSDEIEEVNISFWKEKLEKAYLRRKQLPFIQKNFTDCFRLVHGEGDDMSGLIVDIYADVAIIQPHTTGMQKSAAQIGQALEQVNELELNHILIKSPDGDMPLKYLKGDKSQIMVNENGLVFEIDFIKGQKTGFFIDQRENRKITGYYAQGKSVLNTFCYTGGFSMYALQSGAQKVVSVDSSFQAMAQLEKNIQLNFGEISHHTSIQEDVLKYFKETEETFDMVIVDPPAFAKSIHKKHNAIQGYKRLNVNAIKKVNPFGLLFTFSCSQVIDQQLFKDTIVAAGIESGRKCKILSQLGQPADHPVNLFHPEGLYLKGLLLLIE
jgi:23S rRNA (cytosine1962-C5)-methyltransferase